MWCGRAGVAASGLAALGIRNTTWVYSGLLSFLLAQPGLLSVSTVAGLHIYWRWTWAHYLYRRQTELHGFSSAAFIGTAVVVWPKSVVNIPFTSAINDGGNVCLGIVVLILIHFSTVGW